MSQANPNDGPAAAAGNDAGRATTNPSLANMLPPMSSYAWEGWWQEPSEQRVREGVTSMQPELET
jgi:hypothetical protein